MNTLSTSIRKACTLASLALMQINARADVPLTVEDIITDKGKVKIDIGASYSNSEQSDLLTDNLSIQTGATSFITLPLVVGQTNSNRDTWVGTLGLRYGLTKKAEVYTRMSYLSTSQRDTSSQGTSKQSSHQFADAWAGVNYQFKDDSKTPAFIGFAEIALREKSISSSSFKSALIGLTAYKANDPVVLSLTTAYRFNRARADGGRAYKPGNFILISPSIGFAVNDKVTLTGGVQWINRQADQADGQTIGIRKTSTDVLLGVGYGFSKSSVLTTTATLNASGHEGANLNMSWQHQF
jgi:hypothetical protein